MVVSSVMGKGYLPPRCWLTGRAKRREFGATGWADLVGDAVRILIDAHIEAKG